MTTLITQHIPTIDKEQERSPRRFQRKAEIDRSPLRRSDSICSASSETSLQNFYIHSSKIKNMEILETSGKNCNEESMFLIENYLENTFDKEEEFTKRFNKEQQQMACEIKSLKLTNLELQMKLEQVTKVLKDQVKRESQFTNKKREAIRKERTKELESQNVALKKQIEHLKEEIEDIRLSKLTEETQNSINEYENGSLWSHIEDYVGDKEIFALNDTIRRLYIEIDSLKRRNHFQLELLKMNHGKELKKTKEKLMEVMQSNIKIGKKNMELRNSLRKREIKGCYCFETEVMSRSLSLLSLSSDE